MGSLERFALVMTRTGGAPAANSKWCKGAQGNITPSSLFSGATPLSSILAGASTTGTWVDLTSRLGRVIDPTDVYRVVLVAVVLTDLAIANVRGAALLVATLVQAPVRHDAANLGR